jgi:hypothetical protein
LADIFEKLNVLNKQLQGSNKTLVDVKTKIFGFIINIELCLKNFNDRNFEQLKWLKECEISEAVHLEFLNHLKNLMTDFKERFSDF